jgi:TetR/AcrR family transcriptional regulator
MPTRRPKRSARRSSPPSNPARRPRTARAQPQEAQSMAQRRRAAVYGEIISAAEGLFAQYGFQGTSISDIAARVGISKQNLLYYFPTKVALYKRVLDGVLDEWLERMSSLSDADADPEASLRAYIAAKLQYSRERPAGSRVYANEIISGAPLYAEQIRERVLPALRVETETVKQWASQNRIAPIDPLHLMFLLWAMTQTYADFARQMELLMGKDALSRTDFAAAEELVTRVVLCALGLAPPARALPQLAVTP